MKKIFFIGFNKTATTSFHHLILGSGYSSVHCLFRGGEHSGFIAKKMEDNINDGRPILWEMDNKDAYSDLLYVKRGKYIEANKWFKQLHAEYPDAYFILQTRNMEDWLESRIKHKKGAFIERCEKFTRKSRDELIEDWRLQRNRWEQKMKNYFKDNPNFLVFDIDKDDIQLFIDHVAPDYEIDRLHWRRLNKTV